VAAPSERERCDLNKTSTPLVIAAKRIPDGNIHPPRSAPTDQHTFSDPQTATVQRRPGARQVLCVYPLDLKLCEDSGNTTHGSGWIVQVRPTTEAARPLGFGYLSPLASRGEREGKTGISDAPLCRLGLNNPPTAVGGIPGGSQLADAYSCDYYFLLPVQVPSPNSPSTTVPFMLSLLSIFPV